MRHLLGSQFVAYLTAEGVAGSASYSTVASGETAWEEDEVEDEKVMGYVDRSAKNDF